MASIENGGTPPVGPPKKRTAVEEIYQKKSQLEHILLRPDTYIGINSFIHFKFIVMSYNYSCYLICCYYLGSVEPVTESMWVYDTEDNAMVQREITYVPGLYKIYDEILVNAADNKQRDESMDTIKIEINK